MTKEEKRLLLQDLCARLPYKLRVLQDNGIESILDGCPAKREYCFNLIWDSHHGHWNLCQSFIEEFKPYLRPMSSMTEDEKEEFDNLYNWSCPNSKFLKTKIIDVSELIDWLNAHHFDYRGLIEKGLALEASEGMY